MDYMYDGIDILDENLESARKRQMFRILVYYQRLCLYSGGTIAGEKKLDSNSLQTPLFWDQESTLEQRIYEKMKKWEIRHPIMGIVICTILGGILISLIAGIILEGIMMV